MAAPVIFDAVVLCGGSARRLEGADKGAVIVGGISLLDRAVSAVSSAETIVAVGPRRDTSIDVLWTQERPPGGGPANGIAAGMEMTTAPVVVLLGVDFPFVDSRRIEELVDNLDAADGVVVADAAGHAQLLVGAYKRVAVVDAMKDRDPRNMSVSELLADLDLELVIDPRSTRDCDTWEDIAEAERLLS